MQTFRNFCTLRAQGVRGQLEGKIPSSFSGQAEDSGAFVDASSVWVPDLGDFDGTRKIRDGKRAAEHTAE